MIKRFFLLTLFVAAFSSASTDVAQFDNPQQEADYRSLIMELRCPQCQNNNIADSNATIATDMRNKTLELLKQGKTKQEVVDYMVERYGNFITYDPPVTPATFLLWAMPVLLLLGGIFLLIGRKKQAKPSTNPATAEAEQARLQQILKDNK